MCGRFTLKTDGNALAQHFEVEIDASHFAPPRYNIAPTQSIPVIRRNPVTGRRELAMQRWGLVPPWARNTSPLPALFNARAESLAMKPSFREAFRQRRCLIPADGFYEWQAAGKVKQPWYIQRQDGGLLAFAGLYEGDTCTIITTTPIPLLAAFHNRMPAMASPGIYDAWLDPAADARSLLPSFAQPPAELAAFRVAPLVNRAQFDDPGCIAPV